MFRTDDENATFRKKFTDHNGCDDEIRAAIVVSSIVDRDGSANVSLIGIEHSRGAWTLFGNDCPRHGETIGGFRQRLAHLRGHIDDRVPAARTFQRPGFEHGV